MVARLCQCFFCVFISLLKLIIWTLLIDPPNNFPKLRCGQWLRDILTTEVKVCEAEGGMTEVAVESVVHVLGTCSLRRKLPALILVLWYSPKDSTTNPRPTKGVPSC